MDTRRARLSWGERSPQTLVTERENDMATVVRGARTDEEIQRDVLNELKFEPRVQPNEIGVVVKDGVVALTGWVRLVRQEVGGRGGRSTAYAACWPWPTTSRCGCPLPPSARTPTSLPPRSGLWNGTPRFLWTRSTSPSPRAGSPCAAMSSGSTRSRTSTRVVRRLQGRAGRVEHHRGAGPRLSPTALKEKIEQALVRTAELDAQGIQGEDRGKQGDPRGQGALLGRARRGGAGGVVGAGCDRRGEPDPDHALSR